MVGLGDQHSIGMCRQPPWAPAHVPYRNARGERRDQGRARSAMPWRTAWEGTPRGDIGKVLRASCLRRHHDAPPICERAAAAGTLAMSTPL